MELEIKPKLNPILDEYKLKYKPEELTDDGIPTIETQLKELKLKDEELEKEQEQIDKDKIYKREMIQRVKCLCLLKMNKSIFTNTLLMSLRERGKLQKLMWEYNDIDHKKIIEEFNEKIGEILDDSEFDSSKVPIYQYK